MAYFQHMFHASYRHSVLEIYRHCIVTKLHSGMLTVYMFGDFLRGEVGGGEVVCL